MSLSRNLLVSLTGEAISKVPLYVFEFVLASLLVIDDYAQWAVLALFYRFSAYAHLGILSYLNKRYPLLLGRGYAVAKKNIVKNANASINLLLVCFLLVALVFFIFGYISILELIVFATLIVVQIYTFCQSMARNDGDFIAFVVGLLLFSCVQLIAALLLVEKYTVLGAVISVLIGYSTATLYYMFFSNVTYGFGLIKFNRFKRILKIGFTPFLLTVSVFVAQVADRISLVILDDKQQLAFYGFFALFMQLGIVIVNSVGKVIGPYIITLSGKKGVSSSISISVYNAYFIFIFYFIFSGGCYFFGDMVINEYFEKFQGGMLGVYNYATIGLIMAVCMGFYPQIVATSNESKVIKLNLVFSAILISTIYFVASRFDGYVVYSLASLVLNFIFALVMIKLISHTLGAGLIRVSSMISFMAINTLLVNFYVWY